mgnify:FL=1
MSWIILYGLAWLVATVLAVILTGVCRVLAPRLGLLDVPLHEAHKSHRQPTPVAGGIAMCLAWLATLFGGIAIGCLGKDLLPAEISHILPGIKAVWRNLLLISAVAVGFTALGVWDDWRSMPAWRKFLLQFLLAAVSASWGPRLTLGLSSPVLGWVVTVFWTMTVINALNFFDNMDGLAGGTAALACLFLVLVASIRGQHFVAMLGSAAGGSALGFLAHNRPPAKIFMGDGGSHFLGYCLAVLATLTTYYMPGESPTATPVLIPLLVLAIPLFDAAAVIVLRLRLHLPIYVGDNRHISHRFVNLGLSRGYAVLLVCLLCFIAGASAVTLLWLPPAGVCLVFAHTGALLALVSIIQFYIPEANRK